MIELVDRLEAEDERRVAVLLEHDRGEQRRLEAMRAAVADDAAKAAQRGASVRLVVVGQAIQIALDRERRAKPAISRRSRGVKKLATPTSSNDLRRSARTCSGVHSLPV